MDKLRTCGKGIAETFLTGCRKAKLKTGEALKKEYTPAQKGLILAGVLGIGIIIGFALSIFLIREEAYDLDDFDDFEEFED